MAHNAVSKTAKSLTVQRKKWENGVTKAHDNGLYALLGDCLSFYNDLDGNPELIVELVDHLKAQDIKGNKGTSLTTLIVRAVFDEHKDKRTFSYAKTLAFAVDNKADNVSMHEFIVEHGGIEAIRRGKGSAEKAAKARAASLLKSKDHFSKSAALGSPVIVNDGDRTLVEGRLFVAIMREEVDGNYSMVFDADNESLLNSAFSYARKIIPDLDAKEGGQPVAPESMEEIDEVSPAADAKAMESEAGSNSVNEAVLADAKKETEPQGGAKSDEDGADPAARIENRRGVTLSMPA